MGPAPKAGTEMELDAGGEGEGAPWGERRGV